MFTFKSFRTKLLTLLLATLVIVLGLVYAAVNRSTYSNTLDVINDSLFVAGNIFDELLANSAASFLAANESLTQNSAFRDAYFVTENTYQTRLEVSNIHVDSVATADLMYLLDLDYNIQVDTSRPGEFGSEIPWPGLLEEAEYSDTETAASIVTLNDSAFQMVVVPLRTPTISAWVLIGRELDSVFLEELQKIINVEVTLLAQSATGAVKILASTLATEAEQSGLLQNIAGLSASESAMLNINDEAYVALQRPLTTIDAALDGEQIFAVIQQSMSAALAPYQVLENQLIVLFFVGLVVAALLALQIAQSVTKPLLSLAQQVKEIEGGDYSRQVELKQRDEVGQLADSVNKMAVGLAEKERVRDLLGKVVSPEIAEELLSKKIELGGEERQVTVLFSDVLGFTTLCENMAPEQVLNLLNTYLSKVSDAIELHKGVVDKYVGDAVMALFGAPVKHSDDVRNALHAALAMKSATAILNEENKVKGEPVLETGIGIHTGSVVAGNLGSANRMNYTVIGDTVNLSARLESLTRKYDVPIIVSEDIYKAAPDFIYRELDKVIVKGKQQAVTIFELVATPGAQTKAMEIELAAFADLLRLFRQQDWDAALQVAQQLCHTAHENNEPAGLYKLYEDRISSFKIIGPPAAWDGVYHFSEK